MATVPLTYVEENFPIEIDLCNLVYELVSDCMYNKKYYGTRQSGLYGTKSSYFPEPGEVRPVLFGTLYSGGEYAEVRFSKTQKDKLGKLEILLFGKNQRRLKQIQNKMGVGIKRELDSRKK